MIGNAIINHLAENVPDPYPAVFLVASAVVFLSLPIMKLDSDILKHPNPVSESSFDHMELRVLTGESKGRRRRRPRGAPGNPIRGTDSDVDMLIEDNDMDADNESSGTGSEEGLSDSATQQSETDSHVGLEDTTADTEAEDQPLVSNLIPSKRKQSFGLSMRPTSHLAAHDAQYATSLLAGSAPKLATENTALIEGSRATPPTTRAGLSLRMHENALLRKTSDDRSSPELYQQSSHDLMDNGGVASAEAVVLPQPQPPSRPHSRRPSLTDEEVARMVAASSALETALTSSSPSRRAHRTSQRAVLDRQASHEPSIKPTSKASTVVHRLRNSITQAADVIVDRVSSASAWISTATGPSQGYTSLSAQSSHGDLMQAHDSSNTIDEDDSNTPADAIAATEPPSQVHSSLHSRQSSVLLDAFLEPDSANV
jgi:hypothetical protein